MTIPKLFLATIAGTIVFLLLGLLFHEVLLFEFLLKNPGKGGLLSRPQPAILFLIAGSFFQALLFAILLPKWNAATFSTGLIPGAVFGFLFAAANNCMLYGYSLLLSKQALVIDILSATVIASLAAGVMAAINGIKVEEE